MVQKGILDTVLEYSDRASRRNTELDTRRLVLLKELELARKNGDKVAEAVAQQKMQVLQRQQNRSGSLDRVLWVCVVDVWHNGCFYSFMYFGYFLN